MRIEWLKRQFTLVSAQISGFTLAELLIALAILGVIAAFTIPKVLTSQQDTQFNSIAKEDMATLSAAYQTFLKDNALQTSTTPVDLMPFINYVKVDTTSLIDHHYSNGSITLACDQFNPCVKMHNGSTILLLNNAFSGSASNNFVFAMIDPDGKVTDNTTNGPGKSVEMSLYANGRVTTFGTMSPNSVSSFGTWGPCPSCDPPWFRW